MIIEIALVVIALALCFICVSLMRAQTGRRIKAERQLQAHQAKGVHWEKVVNIREDRMKAWDSTDAGQRLAGLSDGLSDVGVPNAQGIYWVHGLDPEADMPYAATEKELDAMRLELTELEQKRRTAWKQIVQDLPLHSVSEDPRGLSRYPSIEQANAYRRPS
jgi:hypothetical protein